MCMIFLKKNQNLEIFLAKLYKMSISKPKMPRKKNMGVVYFMKLAGPETGWWVWHKTREIIDTQIAQIACIIPM